MIHDDDLDDAPRLSQVSTSNWVSSIHSSNEYVTLIDGGEPEYFEEAFQSEEKK